MKKYIYSIFLFIGLFNLSYAQMFPNDTIDTRGDIANGNQTTTLLTIPTDSVYTILWESLNTAQIKTGTQFTLACGSVVLLYFENPTIDASFERPKFAKCSNDITLHISGGDNGKDTTYSIKYVSYDIASSTPITGNVNVTNFPAVQEVNDTNGNLFLYDTWLLTNNIHNILAYSGVAISNFPSNQAVTLIGENLANPRITFQEILFIFCVLLFFIALGTWRIMFKKVTK
jgi:hypothetical protein